jgi:beta-lactamase class A
MKSKINPLYILLLTIFLTSCADSSNESLRKQIQDIITKTDGTIGFAIKNLDTNDTLTFNNDHNYPMQSVYKFPLALAVLHKVDKGELSLYQYIRISKNDLLPNTWSPIREKYPEAEVNLLLSEVLAYTVSQSDNNGCDILFRLLGGTKIVDDYMLNLGFNDISIKGTEEEMHADWNVQFTNCCKPTTMVQLLEELVKNDILSSTSTEFLWKQMVVTTTGPNRIKGLLPLGTVVAHKTGSSGKNADGITAAVNDAGIIVLPNGQQVAIAIFISNTKSEDQVSERVIAEISKKVFDYYSK